MEPVTIIFMSISLWQLFSSPDPVCPFTEQVVISRDYKEVTGELTTYYKCEDLVVIEKLGE